MAKHLDNMGALSKTVDLMHDILNPSHISIEICLGGLDGSLKDRTIVNDKVAQ